VTMLSLTLLSEKSSAVLAYCSNCYHDNTSATELKQLTNPHQLITAHQTAAETTSKIRFGPVSVLANLEPGTDRHIPAYSRVWRVGSAHQHIIGHLVPS